MWIKIFGAHLQFLGAPIMAKAVMLVLVGGGKKFGDYAFKAHGVHLSC